MNPFDAMTHVLTQVGRVDRSSQPEPGGTLLHGKAAAMRHALATGPKTAAQLARVAGVRPALVQGLLKWDMRIGRVATCGTRTDMTYALADDHQLAEQQRLRDAIALVRRAGYSVTPCGQPAAGLEHAAP